MTQGRTERHQALARPEDQRGAIYCRISHVNDDDQTGVDRQERICREIAGRLGVTVAPGHVFVDNNRSAWKRDRKRPGWDAMLEAMKASEINHVIAYHPDRLMRQPRDLEELLSIADDRRITLHGEANRRDLSDSNDRFILRIEVAHACRSSDDTSRRLRDEIEDRARAGRPHTGVRRYGYTPDGKAIVEEEAEAIREAFRRYLDGESPVMIAKDFHARGLVTAQGRPWSASRMRDLLASHHVAGIRFFRGKEYGPGNWPAIIDRGQWDEVQQLRSHRAAKVAEKCVPQRFYLLRGVVMCGSCGVRMGGSQGRTSYEYRCARRDYIDGRRCDRTIGAERLEEFCRAVAIEVLSSLDVTGRAPVVSARSDADVEAEARDQQKLNDLYAMWDADEMSTAEYRERRRAIEKRMRERQRQTVQRPVAVLEGIAGPDAARNWERLEEAEDHARINAIYRFLFAAVRIGPATRKGRGFDTGRISIDPNPLD